MMSRREHSLKSYTLYFDQVFSSTRVPTQFNTSQHESTKINTSQHESNTSPTRVNTNQREPDTSQHESTQVVKHEPTRVQNRF